jgi:hypothetical protein
VLMVIVVVAGMVVPGFLLIRERVLVQPAHQ